MKKPLCVIPARMNSSRFPGKPLEKLLGLPLVLHVYERCRLYSEFVEVIIATCDDEISAAADAHGAKSVLTSEAHDRATDRVQEAVEILYPAIKDEAVVVMVQGDELLITPSQIKDVVEAQSSLNAPVVNFASRLDRAEDQNDVNTVKVVMNPSGGALYFSRSVIPSGALGADAPIYQQTGIMAFTWEFLVKFSSLPQTPLEKIESVDMLRVLEHGDPIHVVTSEMKTLGVDTPADMERGEAMLAADPTTGLYLGDAV